RRPGSPSTGPASASTRTRSRTTPGRPTSRPVCASAPRRSRPRGWGTPRCARSPRLSTGSSSGGATRPGWPPCATRCSPSAPSSCRTPRRSGRSEVIGYLSVIAASFVVSCAAMPLLRNLSFRVGAVVHPDARRIHTRPTALLGGAGIVAGVLVGFVVAWLTGEFEPVFRTIAPPLGVVLATLCMYAVGQLDDLRDVSAPAKTAGSVLAGSALAISGVSILFFRIPFVGLVALPPDLATLITVLWVVGMAMAVNLIDGLD